MFRVWMKKGLKMESYQIIHLMMRLEGSIKINTIIILILMVADLRAMITLREYNSKHMTMFHNNLVDISNNIHKCYMVRN
jgi:hypothetical protein